MPGGPGPCLSHIALSLQCWAAHSAGCRSCDRASKFNTGKAGREVGEGGCVLTPYEMLIRELLSVCIQVCNDLGRPCSR